MGQAGATKDALVAGILGFLGDSDLFAVRDVRAALEQEIDAGHPAELLALKAQLTADDGWAYYPSSSLARRIHHLLAHHFLTRDSAITGAEHLATVGDAPAIICTNHLSYSDANVIEILLHRAGGAAAKVSSRLTALAGPKVFTSRERRFSSLCFGTIKVPQSAEVSSEEAVLQARAVARAARRAIEIGHERLAAGDVLILFGEGTRSRSGGMQPMLPAVARYFDAPGTWIVPAGLTGSETLFPVDGALQPARITMTIGRPFLAECLRTCAGRHRRAMVDAVGLAIAALLPSPYRGAYANGEAMPAAADAYAMATRRTAST